jgi:hypothetical protein
MSSTSDPALQINQLPTSIEVPTDERQLREFLSLLFRRITDAVNKKEGSLYYPQELGNFQSYFTINTPYIFRNVYRMVVNFGELPNASTKSVAHGIVGIDPTLGNSTFSFTRIFATASNQTNGAESFIPIPWASSSGTDNIQITVDNTNVNITTTSDKTAYTICYVVLEYVKTN